MFTCSMGISRVPGTGIEGGATWEPDRHRPCYAGVLALGRFLISQDPDMPPPYGRRNTMKADFSSSALIGLWRAIVSCLLEDDPLNFSF